MLPRFAAVPNFLSFRFSFNNASCRTVLVFIGVCLIAVNMGNAQEVGNSCTPKTKLPSAFLCIEERVVDCRNSPNPRELLHCAASELQRADNELNRIYQRVLQRLEKPNDEYADYKSAKKSLIEGQRAWVTFKKSDCAVPGHLNIRGNIQSNEMVSCEIKHTRSRIADLAALLVP